MKLQIAQTELSADPVAVFEKLVEAHDCCFLLETLTDEQLAGTSGQSYIGVAPEHRFAARGQRFSTDSHEATVDNPYRALQDRFTTVAGLPRHYVGGLVGYMSHEAIAYSE